MIPTLPPKIKEAIDLLVHLLDSSPESRLDAAAALKHPFLSAATFEEFDDITVQDFSNQYPKSLIITINANSHRFNQLK